MNHDTKANPKTKKRCPEQFHIVYGKEIKNTLYDPLQDHSWSGVFYGKELGQDNKILQMKIYGGNP